MDGWMGIGFQYCTNNNSAVRFGLVWFPSMIVGVVVTVVVVVVVDSIIVIIIIIIIWCILVYSRQ